MTVTIYVPDLPDFSPVIEGVKKIAGPQNGITLIAPKTGYWQIRAAERIAFSRKDLGLRVALWYSMLAGGYCGKMKEYSRDTLILENEAAA